MEYGRLESFGAIHFERAHSVKTSRSRILLRCDHRDKVLATDNLNQGDARQLDVVAVQLSPVAGRAIWLAGKRLFLSPIVLGRAAPLPLASRDRVSRFPVVLSPVSTEWLSCLDSPAVY